MAAACNAVLYPAAVTAGILIVYVLPVSYTHLDVYKRQGQLRAIKKYLQWKKEEVRL